MSDITRRKFLVSAGVAAAALGTAGAAESLTGSTREPDAAGAGTPSPDPEGRRAEAYRVRHDAALAERARPLPATPTNGDETRYPDRIASYTKGLPHDERGIVDATAYAGLVAAIEGGTLADFETVALGGRVKLANPLAAYAFELEGRDSHQVGLAPPPAFASAEIADEIVELYWQALTRDVPFASYDDHPLIAAAARDLSSRSEFRGPKVGGSVTPATLFRGVTPGDLNGPYLSQFLWLDVPQGIMRLPQRGRVPVAGDDYMTTYPEWLSIQRGHAPARQNVIDPEPRLLRNGRDLAEYVHRDFSYQAFLNAALILLGMGAPLKQDNPYRHARTQSGFVTFGAPHVLDCLARVATPAMKATWYQKWLVHRRLRPEAFAARVHEHMMGAAHHPLAGDVLHSAALDTLHRATGSYVLPMAYPEGCPTHPAYPAAHAAIAGAGATVLKAFFDESFAIPDPMVANTDGTALQPWRGTRLTVGGELNKLAANIALARNTAGVHWRSDGIEGLRLGEAVAGAILAERRATCPETFAGFGWSGFDGVTTRV